MRPPSMNHVYRLIWSTRLGCFVAVAEFARAGGKAARCRVLGAVAATLLGVPAVWAEPLPTGAQITQGAAQLSRQADTLTIRQDTGKLVTNWQSFDIGAGHTVQFVQPSAAAVALNRVVGAGVSNIQGALRANGQVFLLNPNGILFSPTAQVDVAGLVASTLSLSDHDFLAGRYRFEGSGSGSVTNQGLLRTATGGTVALIAAKVVNTGRIETPQGQTLLASGSTVTLDIGGPVQLEVERGVLDGLVENGGAILADGGKVLLTAKAADQLARSVVNQTGLIQARTLASGERGEIVLLGDLQHGELHATGRLDASAPNGGDGGFIETSAARVDTGALQIDAGAAHGQGGEWLIDPFDYNINVTAAANIAGALNTGTSVTVSTVTSNPVYGGGAAGSGDITVASPISKTAGGNATLTLRADRSITVSSPITATVGQLGLTLSAANNSSSAVGGVAINANLASNGGRIMIGGAGGSITTAQANGIGYAINSSASTPAVRVGTNVSIGSAGGTIVLNGHTTATTPSYDATKAGVYVLSGATIDSGGGNLYINATSSGDAREFAFGVEGNSGTVTTFRTGATSGNIVVNVNNTQNVLGSLGLVNNGNQARIQFWAPSVAHMLFRLNGNNQAAQFTQSPPCHPGYPNCGTMVIPGGNNSYTYAGYNVVNMAMLPIYVFTGSGSRTYDGTTSTAGLPTPTSLGGPGGFTVTALGPLVFNTPGKNAGSYTELVSSSNNPANYQGISYAVAYFNQGTYTVSPKALTNFAATNKVYDGTTAAAVTSSDLVVGDSITLNATGSFAQANVGNGINVNITGVTLAGADAGNYTVGGFGGINTTANITPAALTVTANADSKTYDALAYSGGNGVSYSGFVNGETAAVLGGTLSYGGTAQGAVNAGSYGITPQGLTAGNYTLSFVPGTLSVSPATLTYTANVASRSYGGTNPAFTGSVTGLVGGETLAGATSGSLAFSSPATATSNVGSYAINGGGLTANHGNYVFAQAAGNATALTINPAALTVTANADSKTYDALAYSGGNGVSYSGFVNGETTAVLGGTLSYGGTAQGAVNAGSYGITPQGLTAGNYTLSFVPGTLSVSPATLTYTANVASRSYGGTNPAFTGSVTGLVGGETLAGATSGSLAFSSPASATSNVGSHAINGGGLTANHGNYVFAQAAGNASALTINPAALTVTANADSKTYDALAYSGGNGVSYSGFVNGETAAVLGGTLSYGGTAQGAVNAGSYGITPQGLTAGNYTLSFVPGTLNVSPATLTYTANVASRSYGGTNPAFTGSVTGLVGGETLAGATSGSLAFSSPASATSNVGSHAINGGGLTANHGNYVFAQAAGNASALTINPAALTVTANADSKTYDALAYSGGNGVSYSGFVNGETAAVLGGTLSYGGTAQGAVNVGSYGITPQGLTAGNYTLSFVPGTLSVSPATLTYTANVASRSYGGTNPAFTGSVTGLVGGETLAGATSGSLAFSSPASATSNVGSYAINGGGLTANHGNYVFAQAAGNATALTINPAALTVTANADSKTYDALAYSGGNGVSYSGFVNGETAAVLGGTLSYGGTAQGAVNVGSYSIVPQGLTAANYALTFLPGALTITPTHLQVITGALTGTATKVYDGTTVATLAPANYLLTGFVGSDGATVTKTSGSYADRNAGSGKLVSVSLARSDFAPAGATDLANYVLPTSVTGSIGTITPAPLTVTANAASKTYDALAYSGGNGVSYSGFVNGETAAVLGGTLSYGGTAQGAVNAGSYGITPQGLTAGNYTLSFVPGTLSVTPATLTYTANVASRSYGGTNPAFTGSVTGLVGGETLAGATSGSLAFSSPATATSNVGSYAINGGGLTANHGNYVFTQAAGNASALTITPAALTVTANADSKTYDALAYSGGNGVSYSGFVNGETAAVLGGTLSYGGTAQGAVNVGSYGIAPQGLTAGNYTLSFVPGTLNVNPATLTYTANVASRSYGGTNPAFTGSVTGLVGGETLAGATSGSLAFSSPASATSNVGSHAINGGGLTANHGNYVFAQAAGNASALTINPAALTVTANADSKTYDALAYSGGNGVSYSGFVNGETAAVLGGALSYGGSAQGAVNAGSYSIVPQGLTAANYALTFLPGTLTITPAQLQVITGALTGTATKVYDGTTVATLAPANYLLTGFVGSEGATVTKTSGSYADRNAGSGKLVSVSLARSDFAPAGATDLANYVLPTSVTGPIGTITPAPLVLAATAANKVYDGTTSAPGAPTVMGLMAGDTLTGLTQTYADKNAGVGKTVQVVGGWTLTDGAGGGNYSVTSVASSAGEIGRRAATVSAQSASLMYNGLLQAQPAPATNGFLSGDDVAVGGAASGRNAGVYQSALAVSGVDAGNYDISLNDAALTITPAPLLLTATPVSKTYDGTVVATGTPLVSGLQAGDTIAGLAQAFTDKNAGNGKTVRVTGYTLADGNGGNNYAVTALDATNGAVTPATLTLTAMPVQQIQGAAPVPLTGGVSGFVNGETQETATTGALVFRTIADPASPAGIYAVEGGGLAAVNGNYVFAQAPVNSQAFVVTPAPLVQADTLVTPPVSVPNFPDNAQLVLGRQAITLGGGALNYVPVDATTGAALTVAAGAPSAAVNPAGEEGAAGEGSQTAPTGTAQIAVPSANGPLDVFVLDGGLNVDPAARDEQRDPTS
ncbi:YDG domain-containing protein [Chitiniphilus purpureus]|uniref:YDG domain-containing protein n=1 Tax=Chitiniphilus purpureus TaxID=2981137 RepID=A0ABY6DM73_9NEIS|nr:MBG domain-containing protein [Chitiniphilus sp. CD1]UXY15451.1 YDG domain-containing protein [Chitiniphilus sp. CD1]